MARIHPPKPEKTVPLASADEGPVVETMFVVRRVAVVYAAGENSDEPVVSNW